MTKYLSILAVTLFLFYSGCSEDSTATIPTGPGPGGSSAFSDTGTWSVASAFLILRTAKTEGGCRFDTSPAVYADTTYLLTERMAYSLNSDTGLVFTDYDTSRNPSTGQTVAVKSETYTYRRIGTGAGLTGTWYTHALPVVNYLVGTVGLDEKSPWAFAVSLKDTLTLKTDSAYGKNQVILYSSVPDSLLRDSVATMLRSWVSGFAGASVVSTGSTVTASVTALLPNKLVITQSGSYPNTMLTAGYKGLAGTQYKNPDSNLKCRGEAAFSEVLGLFYQDLYSTGKRAATAFRQP